MMPNTLMDASSALAEQRIEELRRDAAMERLARQVQRAGTARSRSSLLALLSRRPATAR